MASIYESHMAALATREPLFVVRTRSLNFVFRRTDAFDEIRRINIEAQNEAKGLADGHRRAWHMDMGVTKDDAPALGAAYHMAARHEGFMVHQWRVLPEEKTDGLSDSAVSLGIKSGALRWNEEGKLEAISDDQEFIEERWTVEQFMALWKRDGWLFDGLYKEINASLGVFAESEVLADVRKKKSTSSPGEDTDAG